MSILRESDRKAVRQRLEGMEQPVTLVFFTQEMECRTCRETHQLLEELSALSDMLSLEVVDFVDGKETAAAYGIERIPATVVRGDRDYGIRYYGIPAGYEFASLLEDVLSVSRRDSGLSPESRERLKAVSSPLHIQVFVTPT